MFQGHFISRALRIGLLGCAVVLSARPSASETAKGDKTDKKEKAARKACANTYKSAQQLETSAHLRQANDLLLTCMKATCGAVTRQRCTARHNQIEAEIPTVIP